MRSFLLCRRCVPGSGNACTAGSRERPWYARIQLAFGVFYALLGLAGCATDGRIQPQEPATECLREVASHTFDIITWNLQDFPRSGQETVEYVASVLSVQDADLVALQEISDSMSFQNLVKLMPGWQGHYVYSGQGGLAFLYKTLEISVVSEKEVLFTGDTYAFPRPVAALSAAYRNRVPVRFFNLHLKCCGGGDNLNRRLHASEKLKAYLDSGFADQPLVVLGDFNDVLTAALPGDNPFLNFLSDSSHYRFADQAIARGSSDAWSYPLFPSHIDHILISDELYDAVLETVTIRLDACQADFFDRITDHRPLMIRLRWQ
jgi:endonuclease/exonuclease/phosphatase family metal-dependent hydrolase